MIAQRQVGARLPEEGWLSWDQRFALMMLYIDEDLSCNVQWLLVNSHGPGIFFRS